MLDTDGTVSSSFTKHIYKGHKIDRSKLVGSQFEAINGQLVYHWSDKVIDEFLSGWEVIGYCGLRGYTWQLQSPCYPGS